ncbi:hypothetical protein COB55_02240 [Candidatus Wolfebacteria bacterium]|nr:MAG: hypothetical protein COB55_02240 [Candidatus Wolfebacteria bacterium]
MPYKQDTDGFVSFTDVSQNELPQQCQYSSRYINGYAGYPDLGKGLRVTDTDKDYYDIRIHIDDIPEFVLRYKAYKKKHPYGPPQ